MSRLRIEVRGLLPLLHRCHDRLESSASQGQRMQQNKLQNSQPLPCRHFSRAGGSSTALGCTESSCRPRDQTPRLPCGVRRTWRRPDRRRSFAAMCSTDDTLPNSRCKPTTIVYAAYAPKRMVPAMTTGEFKTRLTDFTKPTPKSFPRFSIVYVQRSIPLTHSASSSLVAFFRSRSNMLV